MAKPGRYHELLDIERRRMVLAALELHAGNRTAAAKYLEIPRPGLYALIRRLGLAAAVTSRWPVVIGAAPRKN